MNRVIFRPFIVPLLLVLCTLFYYFGELIDWASWDVLRTTFFYGVHDIHRLLFLAPIIYSGYTAGIRAAIIVTLVSFIIFLPRAFFISPYPDPLLRMVIFTLFAGVTGYLVARIRNEQEQSRQLKVTIESERNQLLSIIDRIADRVFIIGPDFRIQFMNSNMKKEFGDGNGLFCYKHLRNLDTPCEQVCKITDVINNREIRKWRCSFPDGNTYEVVASPYVDSDDTVCQLTIFREITE
jgi:PAS domain-containing protein